MIITYSFETFPNLITAGFKIHSIRKRGRWHSGRVMHHWMHSPRHPWKHPHCFLINKCTGTEPITINTTKCTITLDATGQQLDPHTVAINDGLGYAHTLFDWIDPKGEGIITSDMEIVHWTAYKYANQLT